MDKFKQVNDQYGHHIGDQILAGIGSRLKKELRQADIVGRWGGDEFLVLLNEVTHESIERVIKKIREVLNLQPYITDYGELSVQCSLGGVVPTTTDSLDILIKKADQLMYSDKKKNKPTIE